MGAVFNHGLLFAVELQGQTVWLTMLLPFVLFLTHWSESKLNNAVQLKSTDPQSAIHQLQILTGFLIVPLTWLSHLAGASVGREGVAVRLGRSVSGVVSRFSYFESLNFSELFVLRCGSAAGFAAVFGTPCAAVTFALEAFAQSLCSEGNESERAAEKILGFVLVAIGALLSNYIAEKLFWVSHTDWSAENSGFSLGLFLFLIGLSFVFYWFSRIHTNVTRILTKFFDSMLLRRKKLLLFFVFCFSLVLSTPHFYPYKNLGTNFLGHFFQQNIVLEKVDTLDWLFKWLTTVISLSMGFRGGEVTPLLAVGSLTAYSLNALFSVSATTMAAAGFSGLFAAVLRVPLTGAVLAFELFGSSGWTGAVVSLLLLIWLRVGRSKLSCEA